MRLPLIVLGMMIVGTPAMAKEKANAPNDPNRKVCRQEGATGSVFVKRVCHTAAEWRAIDENNARQTKTFNDGQSGATPVG